MLTFPFTLNAKQDGDRRVIALGTDIDVQETSPATYEWNTAEELTPQGYQQGGIPNPQNIASPTGVTLLSNATTSIVGADGVARSRIQVSWTTPADGYATEIQIQFQVVAGWAGDDRWNSIAVVHRERIVAHGRNHQSQQHDSRAALRRHECVMAGRLLYPSQRVGLSAEHGGRQRVRRICRGCAQTRRRSVVQKTSRDPG